MKMSMSELPALTHEHLPIGAHLVKAGHLKAEDIERVLQYQQQHNLRFGAAAVRMGLVRIEDVEFALSRQFEYAYLQKHADRRTLSDDLPAAYEPFSQQVEQIRSVRSQLMLHWFDKSRHQNVLAVVGSDRQEGRTYLAANLAVVFSQAGQNTLLIDGNLRVPRLHDMFGLRNKVGLSTMLAGHAQDEPIIRISELSGLFVLPAGPVPPNPLELLSRPAMGELLAKMRTNFDLVIVDTPALSVGDDAALLSVQIGTALVVARSHQTRLAAYRSMVSGLQSTGVAVLGTVLNDLPANSPAAVTARP